jgi:hypothetical protein
MKYLLCLFCVIVLAGCGEPPSCSNEKVLDLVKTATLASYDKLLSDLTMSSNELVIMAVEDPKVVSYDQSISSRSCTATLVILPKREIFGKVAEYIKSGEGSLLMFGNIVASNKGYVREVFKYLNTYALTELPDGSPIRISMTYKVQKTEDGNSFYVETLSKGPIQLLRIMSMAEQQARNSQ